MGKIEAPFEPLLTPAKDAALSRLPVYTMAGVVATGRFHGFDLDEVPLVSGLEQLRGEIVAARTTVSLRQQMVGESVVIVFEQGDLYRPIIIGVVQSQRPQNDRRESGQSVPIQADDDRFVVSAEREIVLRCGDASITLTRAGKVIIKGNYILSRSAGYNKIKGAAIDIN